MVINGILQNNSSTTMVLDFTLNSYPNPFKNTPKTPQKYTQNPSKIHPKPLKNTPKNPPVGVLT
jgi:hypothetical protein